ncbi:DUF4288 domain-containing protein [Dolosigranulum pigrum]|uniref:DUF4288 domain-containing protein n=1 Tax=Dolosigranulum pigrum TaxID=29394 RepID=UPI0015EB2959|nr:DUF4288 domain-containing protein [Dolosigranulum pigrum]
MSKILSISTLFQSIEVHGNIPHESFEHRIVLLYVDDDLSDQQLRQKIYHDLMEAPYETAEGTVVQWRLQKILDVFELIDALPVQSTEFPIEVYSRYFFDDGTLKDVINRYFSDFVWEDDNLASS